MNSPNMLLYKWLVINSFACLLVYLAWLMDWITLVFESDASYLSVAIGAVFVVFWMISNFQAVSINREIARFATGRTDGIAAAYFDKLRAKSTQMPGQLIDQTILAGALRARLYMPVQALNYVSNILILLGLIGTVVGFVIAVGGLGDSIAGGGNIERIQGVLGQIVNGMGVALFTTLVGSILGGLWLQLHFQMLARAVGRLVMDIVEHADIQVIPRLAAESDEAGVADLAAQ